jgi:hypothetical protein
MRRFKSQSFPFKILFQSCESTPYPYLRSQNGGMVMFSVSPHHGRSFLLTKKENGRYVISKGNGLAYTSYPFLNTNEMGNNTWGLLLEKDAIRDFQIGLEIQSLGIKTNQMEYVLRIDKEIKIECTGDTIKPILLQYNVESPYRICDFSFMTPEQINFEIEKWDAMNEKGFKEKYLIAANVMIKTIRIMHDRNILHNAIHSQNYTWALELLDFELARTDTYPYPNQNDEDICPILFRREIIQTYEIINYIGWCLKEEVHYKQVDSLFSEYGFYLEKLWPLAYYE